MPVIEIAALPPAGEIDVTAALGHVAGEVADFLGEDPRGTWAIWRPIGPGHYAEGHDAPASQPKTTHPAVVHVLANRTPDQVGPLLEVVGAAVVRALGLEEGNVVVRFEAADPERMFWG